MPNITFLKNYTPPAFLIESANLQFDLDPKETIVTAQLHIKHNSNIKYQQANLVLNGVNLTLQTIKINNQILSNDAYQITQQTLTIFNVPEDFVLETVVKIHPEQNLSCTGLYLTNDNFCTQNEPCGFRRLTYFLDRPDILTKFTVSIIANKNTYPILLSNGNLISHDDLPNDKHRAIWQDPFPKSPYLFALVAGKFGLLEDYYITSSGRKITLRIYAARNLLNQCHHAMKSLQQAMAWEEKNFGLEYDLDLYQIVAINDLNFSAMENKGLNVFNSTVLLATPITATDADFNRIAAVIAHEYFHNYTGNRVTCRNWFQVGLKEGLTTLREQMFMEDTYGYSTNRINSIKTMRTKQFAEDSGPLAHPVRLQSYIEIDNFYTTTIYYKSAEIARMLCTIFGREKFQQIMREFLNKFDGQAVTIEDFIQIAEKITKTDLTQFKLWYDHAGTPNIKIYDDWIDQQTYNLRIEQQHPQMNKNFHIPLAIGLVDSTKNNTATEILQIKQKNHTFSFAHSINKPIVSLLRDFSAPVKIEYQYNDEQLLELIRHDQNPISAWDASQQLAINIIKQLYNKMVANQTIELPQTLIIAHEAILDNHQSDPALAAEMLQLPMKSYLLETLPQAEITTIHFISEFLKLELAKTLKNKLLLRYQQNYEFKSYNLDPIAIGKRSFKNMCLHYLMHLNTTDIFALCLQQLEQTNNMTDTIACLNNLANSTYNEREQLLEEYYQKWQKQPNLVLKWLSINANIKLPQTLQRIKKLTYHSAFDIKNPNKVYALIRTFCENNHINFHELSGEGYKFLADQILTIDKFNPQLAALITTPLTKGHKLNQTQQQLMQQQLIRIKQEPKLSNNVYEIVEKVTKS